MKETKRFNRKSRRGTAASELAVCLPMLVLIVFGSLQACNLVYLKQGVVTAAYEGSLELAKRNATNSSIVARTQQVLDARGVKNADIRVLPGNVDVAAAALGTPVTVEVTAPVMQNVTLSRFFPLPTTVVSQVSATR